jgi:hypothetical protein
MRKSYSFKTTAEIKEQLEQLLLKLETLQDTHQLPKATSTLHKFHYSNSGFGNWGQYLVALGGTHTRFVTPGYVFKQLVAGSTAACCLLATPTQ